MRLYGRISKVQPQSDGTVKVEGIASSEAVDDQGEVVQAAAMRAAIPNYMLFPALREMHQLSAAGTTLEADVGDDGTTRIFAHVVDPVAVAKVKTRVYRGFSIGGQVTERDTVNRNIITGIRLNEISLVDRPANPEAILDCWKAGATIEGKHDMEGLATIGDLPAGEKLAAVAAKLEPVQIWACGVADHQHAGKADAVKCLEGQAAAKAAKASESADLVLETPPVAVAEHATAPEPADGEQDLSEAVTQDAASPPYALTTLEAAREAIERANLALDRQSVDHVGQAQPAEVTAAAKEAADNSDAGKTTGCRGFAKGMADIGRIAMLITDLGWVCDGLEFESTMEGDNSPQPARLTGIIGELCQFLNALVAEETAEFVSDSDDSGEGLDQVALSAIISSLQKTINDPTQLEALVSTVIEKGARHGATDQVYLDNAAYAASKALATRSASKTEKMNIADAYKTLLDAGASAPESQSPPDNATQDTEKAILDAGATSIAAPSSAPPPRNATQDTGRNAQTEPPQTSAGKSPASPMPKASDQQLLADAVNKIGASIAIISKAGGSQSETIEMLAAAETMTKAGAQAHHVLMDMVHKCMKAFSNGSTCKEDVVDPERHTDMDMTRVHKAHSLIGGNCDDRGSEGPSTTKAAADDDLAKAMLAEKTAENSLLTKTLAEIVPIMSAMNARIEENAALTKRIADTPFPPSAIARHAGGSLTKASDNAAADQAPDLVAALAALSPEEQTLTMIKASQRQPILVRSLATAAAQRENFPAR